MESQANHIVPIALIGWIPVTLAFFMFIPPRRAAMASFLLGWLFLPVIEYKITFLPGLDKTTVTSLAVLAAILLFDTARFARFRPRWYDVPIVVLCGCPLASSIANGLGVYDGASMAFREVFHWGVPYFIGRLYLDDLDALRELAIGLFLAGFVYVPLCLYEIRMSPQLHFILYGFHQHSFAQTARYGGWRPMVFMDHGLMVGMFMTGATLCGVWLRRAGTLKNIFGIPITILVMSLFVTTILLKSVGAIVLLLMGTAALYAIHYVRTSLPFFALAAFPIIYVLARAPGILSGELLVDAAATTLGSERAASLAFRLHNEDTLAKRALERPLFGWGGWGRARVHDEEGRDITTTDGYWIIALGNHGLVGLVALMITILLPALLLPFRVPFPLWTHPRAAAGAVLAMILILWMIDDLFNAMLSPIYPLMAGGLAALGRVGLAESAAQPGSEPQTTALRSNNVARSGTNAEFPVAEACFR